MGFTKSHVLIHWWAPSTNQIKHAFAVRFDENNVQLSPDAHPGPGSLLLTTTDTSI
jgi:hypothetical protein